MSTEKPNGGEGRDSSGQPAERAVFDGWLAAMDPKLAGLQDLFLPDDFPFDYSRESLAQLEGILLATFPTGEAVFADEDRDFLDRAVRYIGETLIRNYGGGWGYESDPEFVYAGVPFVRPDDGTGIPVSPLYLITSLVERRSGAELTDVFDGIGLDFTQYQESKPAEQRVDAGKQESPASKMSEAATEFVRRWTESMDEVLRLWRREYLPADFPFDFSRNSLLVLADMLLERFASEEEVELQENRDLVDGAVRYVGEVIVRAGIAHWFYQDWGDKASRSNVYHRIPYVQTNVVPQEESYVCVPLWSIQALVDERDGTRLAKAYDRAKEDFDEFQATGQ